VSLLLIRHSQAGDPSKWDGDDRLRPLDDRGRRQAEGLVHLLADYELDRIVSSPYLRCIQTVEPLARARGLEIEQDETLGADRLDDVPSVIERLHGSKAAVCTHGDLPWLGGLPFKKGAAWVLDDDLKPSDYLSPAD
jgi:8-oxo-(d)GTP phosphatase